ncbi:MAG: peptidase S15 [Mycobacterium sp.]|nr:peptidase S15 [Mycobacterium sp.]
MGASRYIGRVGGLAVAFGIGTAVLTGYGVASADSTSSGGATGSSSQGSSGSAASSDSAASTSGAQDSAGSESSQSTSGGNDDAADGTAAGGASADDAASDEAAAADAAADEADAADESASEQDAVQTSGSSGASFSAAADATTDSSALESASSSASEDNAEASAAAVVEDQSAAPQSQASPTAVAGLAPVEAAPIIETAVAAPAVVESTAVASPVLEAVNGVLNPFAGDGPGTPPVGSPIEWAAAAAARREIGVFGDPITVDPTLTFTQGVIFGNVNVVGDPTSYTYTLTEDPTGGGKVFLGRTDPTDPQKTLQDGSLSYLPFLDESSPMGAFAPEQFTVMVSELSGLMKLLQKIPLLGDFVEPIVLALQEMPFIGGLLQPIIGYRSFAVFNANVGELVPEGDPVAFTTKVTSFDGVQISTNWFPSTTVAADGQAATIFEGPGLGANGSINPTAVIGTLGFVPGMSLIRDVPDSPLDFNYVSWDPRGEGASGGFLQLDNPFFEGRDTQHIIDYVATLPWTKLSTNGTGDPIVGDPQMGMVGGSYGGGIQWVEAGIDKRVDAIVPAASWNSLNQSLYPTGDFKTSWSLLLGLDLLEAGARINSRIYPAIIQGTLLGFIGESDQAILSSSGPTVLVDAITAPTLIIQGTADGLFPLNESIINAGILAANGVPVKMIWACGGHGVCLNPGSPTAQFENLVERSLTWLTSYLYLGGALPTGQVFQWYDQNGVLRTSNLLPSDPAFYGDPFETTNDGGSLLLQPLCCGGSGPQLKAVEAVGSAGLLVSPALAAPASQAINIPIAGPLLPTQMVGAPELSFTYSGFGTSRHIYAQLVDNETDLVLGNIITPIPVELDGQTHEITISMESIAYSMAPGDSLTLQIVGATSVYADATQWGFIDVSDVNIALPTVAGAGAVAGAVAGTAEELTVAV